MTRLSANASPFAKTATYAHQVRNRVSFGGITACRRFQITPDERSVRFWAWDKGGDEGVSVVSSKMGLSSFPSKIKAIDPTAAAPFEVPPEPNSSATLPLVEYPKTVPGGPLDSDAIQEIINKFRAPAYNPNYQLPRQYANGAPTH